MLTPSRPSCTREIDSVYLRGKLDRETRQPFQDADVAITAFDHGGRASFTWSDAFPRSVVTCGIAVADYNQAARLHIGPGGKNARSCGWVVVPIVLPAVRSGPAAPASSQADALIGNGRCGGDLATAL